MKESSHKPRIALMSYAMDNRQAKGTALYTRKLIEGLLKDDSVDYYLVHYDKVDDPVYKRAREIVMPRVRLPYGSRFVSQLLFFWKYRKDKFDIIHWFQPRLYPFFWLAPAKKIVATVHGAGEAYAPMSFVFSRSVFNFVLAKFNKCIDMAVVDCCHARQEVVKYYGFPADKVECIYLGGGENFKTMDRNEARRIAAKYGIRGEYILDVSRLQPHKNVSALISAYAEMRRRDGLRKEKLVIVGTPIHEGAAPEHEIAKNSGFSGDIMFIEYVNPEDLNAIYSAAELFVFPSLSEGFGLPVVEAMASGVPVIASNTTSLPEIGGNAIISVNPRDINGLADAMGRALTDGNLRQRMIESGLLRAGEFTWKKTVGRTRDLYARLLTE